MKTTYSLTVALIYLSSSLGAEPQAKLTIGDPAPVWQDLPGTDGKTHSLTDFKGKEVIVVVFTCNGCPYAVAYEDRLIEFAKKYTGPDGKVGLVAICVNNVPEDRLPKMKERAQRKGFPFPYLHDASQQTARDFGATRTPEFFVLDKNRKLVYRGAMDDRSDPSGVKLKYLEAAVGSALRGDKVEKSETPPVGCMILFNRKRDDRD